MSGHLPIYMAGTAAVAVTVFALRPVFAKVALNKALRDSVPEIQQIGRTHAAYFSPMEDVVKRRFQHLQQTLILSKEVASETRGSVQRMSPPQIYKIGSIPKLGDRLVDLRVNVAKAYAVTWGYKLKDVVGNESYQRMCNFPHNAGKVMHAGRHVSRHYSQNKSAVDAALVAALDHTGVIDVSAHLQDSVTHVLHQLVPDHFLDVSSHVLHSPVLSGLKTASTEIGLLMDGKTDLSSAITEGAVPAVVRTGFIKVGIALDSSTGWASLGLFTAGAAILGKIFKNKIVKEAVEAETKTLKSLLRKIEDRQKAAMGKINSSIDREFADFMRCAKECPDISASPEIVELSSKFSTAYSRDVDLVHTEITKKFRDRISQIPVSTWFDKILGIDRAAAVKALFQKEQERVNGQLVQMKRDFSKKAQGVPAENFLQWVQTVPVLRKGYLVGQSCYLPQMTESLQTKYANDLGVWKKRCDDSWDKAARGVGQITSGEVSAMTADIKEITPGIPPVVAKINASLKRIGRPPLEMPSLY